MRLKITSGSRRRAAEAVHPSKARRGPSNCSKVAMRTRTRRNLAGQSRKPWRRRDETSPWKAGPKAAGERARACSGPSPPTTGSLDRWGPGAPVHPPSGPRTWGCYAISAPPLKTGDAGEEADSVFLFGSLSQNHEAPHLDVLEKSAHQAGMPKGEPDPVTARDSRVPFWDM